MPILLQSVVLRCCWKCRATTTGTYVHVLAAGVIVLLVARGHRVATAGPCLPVPDCGNSPSDHSLFPAPSNNSPKYMHMLQDSIRRRRRAFAFAVATALVDTMPLSACSFAFRAATSTGARHRRSILLLAPRAAQTWQCEATLSTHRQSLGRARQELLMSTIGTSTDGIDHSEIDMSDFQAKRVVALHEQLTSLGIDAENLSSAATRSMTTTEGYDPYFGKSAIKAYRTFASPRPSKLDAVQREDVGVAAARCARQIDFLAKRHRSHEAEWVRHTDSVESSEHDDDKGGMIGKTTRFPLTIVLDNVRSAFNVGSIFRTADACACAEIITTGITPHPGGSGAEKLAKSALGADRVVPSRHFATTMEAVDFLRNERPEILLVGMETTERSVCYTDVAYPGGIGMDTNGLGDGNKRENDSDEGISREMKKTGTALFFGNEVTGVDTEVMPLLDMVVEIPMFGTKNSLNIAACAPVVMYECIRQWRDLEIGVGGGSEE